MLFLLFSPYYLCFVYNRTSICGVSALSDLPATIFIDNMSLNIEDQNEREVSVLI